MSRSTCPRCESKGYEVFSSYCYCSECNYSEEKEGVDNSLDDCPVPLWVLEAIGEKRSINDWPPSPLVVRIPESFEASDEIDLRLAGAL